MLCKFDGNQPVAGKNSYISDIARVIGDVATGENMKQLALCLFSLSPIINYGCSATPGDAALSLQSRVRTPLSPQTDYNASLSL